MKHHVKTLNIDAKRTLVTLLIANIFILIVYVTSTYIVNVYEPLIIQEAALERFDVNQESSIPTWYNQILLIVSAMLVFVVGFLAKAKQYKTTWLVLAGLFIFMSIDEGASLHELTIGPTQQMLGIMNGPFYLAWVIPVGILSIFVMLFFLRMFLSLPIKYEFLFGSAAFMYLFGALGMEMIGALYVSGDPIYHTTGSWDYKLTLLNGIEEFLEMTGLVILIYGLLHYIGSMSYINVRFLHHEHTNNHKTAL